MKAIIIEPGKAARLADIENTLESLENLVDGWIECTYPFADNACVICNDEGKLIGLEPNVKINGSVYVGTIVIAGLNNMQCDFDDLTDKQIKRYLKMFEHPVQPTMDEAQWMTWEFS